MLGAGLFYFKIEFWDIDFKIRHRAIGDGLPHYQTSSTGTRDAYIEYVRNITGTDVNFDEPSLRQASLRGKRLTQGVIIFDINACETFELVRPGCISSSPSFPCLQRILRQY